MAVQTRTNSESKTKRGREGQVLLQVWIDGDLSEAIRARARECGETITGHVSRVFEEALAEIDDIDEDSEPEEAKRAYQKLATGAAEIITEIQRLNMERDALEEQIQKKTGWFDSPPESLVKAKNLLDERLRTLTKMCESMTANERSQNEADGRNGNQRRDDEDDD